MQVLILDAQGGGVGRLLVEGLKRALPEQELTVVGANALATAAMLRAGAEHGATGENAAVVCAARADLILAPIGMVLCDAMLGEVTPAMAMAVGRSAAHKILIPISRCQTSIAGLPSQTLPEAVDAAVREAVRRMTGRA
ncbi:MAG: DUF3842 family protein [bacterium]|nr:DUF3842 family protein [bacterium]